MELHIGSHNSRAFKVPMSLRKKLLLIILPVIIVLLAIMTVVNYFHAVSIQTKTVELYVSEISRNASVAISDNLEWLKLQMEWIADRPDVQSMQWEKMERYLANRAFTDRAKYNMLFVIDTEGNYYIAGKGRADANLREREYVRDILDRGKSFAMTSPDISKSTGEMKYTIAIPIEQTGEVVGILAANISLNTLCEIAGNVRIGDKGYAFIVDEHTQVIGHKNDNYLMHFSLCDSTNGYTGLVEFSEKIKYGEASGYMTRPEGDKFFVLSFPIDGTPHWSMIAAMPDSEITAGANEMLVYMVIFLFVQICIIVVVISFGIRRIVVEPIHWFCEIIKKVAEGDFHQKFDYNAKDEIGLMSVQLNSMCIQLLEIAQKIKSGALALAEASSQVKATSEHLAEGTNDQASSIEELSATMEQMAGNIAQNTQNASQTRQASNLAYEKFNNVFADLRRVFSMNADIAERIMLINDIAQETNILALNASVEAARAGEYGKGFSIVANEVRKLAENSKVAADQISELSGNGVKISEIANDVMTGTLPKIKETNTLVEDIANASIEQKLGVDQINITVQRLNVVVRENAAASEELASSAENLADQAKELNNTVAFFK